MLFQFELWDISIIDIYLRNSNPSLPVAFPFFSVGSHHDRRQCSFLWRNHTSTVSSSCLAHWHEFPRSYNSILLIVDINVVRNGYHVVHKVVKQFKKILFHRLVKRNAFSEDPSRVSTHSHTSCTYQTLIKFIDEMYPSKSNPSFSKIETG